jgi:hypothetical protein
MPRAFIQLSKVASPRKIEGGTAIEGTLDSEGSFLTVKNSEGGVIGTFRSAVVDGWWLEADQISQEPSDLAARLTAAYARMEKLGSRADSGTGQHAPQPSTRPYQPPRSACRTRASQSPL